MFFGNKKETITQFIKYGLFAVLGYFILILGTWFLVEKIGILKNIAYMIVISFNYIWAYFVNTKIIFSSNFTKKGLIKYCFSLFLFWFLNNFIFNIMVELFDFHYILAIVVNIIFFGILRFLVFKKLVFEK